MNLKNSDSALEGYMMQFAENTGLTGEFHPPDRYLWTDAFAVCNFLELFSLTGRKEFLDLSKMLVDQVHTILGNHRDDDERKGWISGLDHEKGERHPTSGGLRIGKDLNEQNSMSHIILILNGTAMASIIIT